MKTEQMKQILISDGIDAEHLTIEESEQPEMWRKWMIRYIEPNREGVEERILFDASDFPAEDLDMILTAYIHRAAARLKEKIAARSF